MIPNDHGPLRSLRTTIVVLVLSATFATLGATPRDIAKKAFPSVVLLVMEDSHGQPLSLGSGFFVTRDVVATNLHVIKGASQGRVTLVGRKDKLEIVGVVAVDAKRDLVLLKVSTTSAPALRFGDDALLSIGDTVYAVGNPEGLEGTFSQGIVSGLRTFEGDKFLQITAPISPGSSGGPVLNELGEVVGVAVATYREGQNLNFAVPSSYLRVLAQSLGPPRTLADITKTHRPRAIGADSGEQSSEGVIATNFHWNSRANEGGYPSAFTFTIRNRLRSPVGNVVLVIIFYGHDGEPIHSELVRYTTPILGSLAKTLNSDPMGGHGSVPYSGHEMRRLTSRVEIRVITFNVLNE